MAQPPEARGRQGRGGGMNIKIVSHYDVEMRGHMSDFETCANCDFRQAHKEWDEYAVIFSTGSCFGKHDSGVLIFECPVCSEKSWVHQKLCCVYKGEWPTNMYRAARRELLARVEAAQKEWDNSLCATCANMTGKSDMETHAYSRCKGRSGPVKSECDRYSKEGPQK